MLIVSILGVETGFGISDSRGRDGLVTPIVVTTIGLLIVGSTIFGLLLRSNARNDVLRGRFPDSTIVTIRKTDELSTQVLILTGKTQESGIPSETLGSSFSSLVIDRSGAAVWTGGARDLTRTLFLPADRIAEVTAFRSSNGSLLRLVVQKGSVPVQLLIPLVRLGRVGFFSLKDAEVQRIADEVRSRIGLKAEPPHEGH